MSEPLWPPPHMLNDPENWLAHPLYADYTDDPSQVRFLDDPPFTVETPGCPWCWLSHGCELDKGHEGPHECWTQDRRALRWLLCCEEPRDSERLFTAKPHGGWLALL